MRIAVVGAGGVGGYFGARLVAAGEDVAFVARGKQLEALRARGLRIESAVGDLGAVDAVLVAVKTWQLGDLAPSLAPLVGPDTAVVPFLNGVEAADQLAAVLGPAPVLEGIAKIVSYIVAPGHIRQIGGLAAAAFAERDDRPSERVEGLREAFRRAGLGVETPANIHAALWEKFLFVVSSGGVGALTRAPIGISRAVPESRALLEQAMREIEAVARVRGVSLPGDIVAQTMTFVDTLPPAGTASLQRDIAEGKPSELDSWNRAVVRLGREVGVATPLHEVIYRALRPLELRARGQLQFS